MTTLESAGRAPEHPRRVVTPSSRGSGHGRRGGRRASLPGPLAVAITAIVLTTGPSSAAESSPPAGAPAGASTSAVATLRVVVTDLPSDRGDVEIAVCDSPASWSGDAPSFRGDVSPIENGRAEFVFEDVPFGEYAAKLFHDENGNDRFDMSLIGLPKESYAFSNGARAYLGQPSFERSKFVVDAPVTTVEVSFD